MIQYHVASLDESVSTEIGSPTRPPSGSAVGEHNISNRAISQHPVAPAAQIGRMDHDRNWPGLTGPGGAHRPVSKLPSVIGRYQVVSRIGQGGMGSLYLAWDPMLERQVAIKLLRDDNDELRERFAREARSAAASSPQHRHHLRRRRAGRPAVHRHGVHRRRDAGAR